MTTGESTVSEPPLGWDYGIVAFLDLLGFSHFVESDAASVEPTNLKKIARCLREVRRTTPAATWQMRTFSDSVMLYSRLGTTEVMDILSAVLTLQRVFLRSGLLVRGGIAFGKHYSDEEITYSQALVAAYRIERDHARFPRVLVQHDLLSWFTEQPRGEVEGLASLLLRDRDDEVFVHYLDEESLEAHAELLLQYEAARLTASVLEKAQWLAAYHNYVATPSGKHSMVDSPLVAGFRPLGRTTSPARPTPD